MILLMDPFFLSVFLLLPILLFFIRNKFGKKTQLTTFTAKATNNRKPSPARKIPSPFPGKTRQEVRTSHAPKPRPSPNSLSFHLQI